MAEQTQETHNPTSPFMLFKYTYSIALLIFSIAIIMALIFQKDTKISREVHPILAFVLIWGCVIWLSMVEGGQGPLVGLPPVQKELYEESHPITHQICTLAHKGDNLDRYLIGRQFMVIFIAFTINSSGGPLPGSTVFGLPDWFQSIFLGSGIAMILLTTNIGQLMSQVNGAHCMLDFINTHFMTFTLYVTLIIEFSGVCHTVYLIQMVFANLAGQPIQSKEEPRDAAQNIFFWGRVLMSMVILFFCFAVTLTALFQGKTTMWDGIPPAVSVILFFAFMSVVGMLEGMQIAFFAVAKLSNAEQSEHPTAMKTCELLFRGEGRNLPGFMVGRQICVTLCFFFIARVTTLNVEPGTGENIFGVSDGLQAFFNLGFLGALITTIVASIAWQLIASAFPVAFLSNPLVYILLRWCLFLEWTGICSASWVLAMTAKKIGGYQLDEVYIGTAEERLAKHHGDEEYNVVPGHMYPGVPTLPPGTMRVLVGGKLHDVIPSQVDDTDIEAVEQSATA